MTSTDAESELALDEPLSLSKTLAGKRLLVVGGTGFLGKVWCSLLLTRFPDVGHVYLVVRPKGSLDTVARFEQVVLKSAVFHPLREQHRGDFDSFIAEKVTPIDGDIAQPLCGLDAPLRDELRGQIDAVVNVAGVVDFDPPLDEALEVNAFGCQNLVALARDLGDCPVLHTSTCFTAGSRTGPIEEQDPRLVPFPRMGELDPRDFSPDREIAECLDLIEQARHRASDAFRQSHFLDQAKTNLREKNEPVGGDALTDELGRVKRKFVEGQLAGFGMERAQYWGWPNTYTYTKSIGEQIIAGSGLPFCIVRPSIVESTVEFPFPGWNEGINTSAPIIFLIREGGLQVPGSTHNLDMIPCDMVCGAILLALGELLEGRAEPVYQAASSDVNPCTMARFFELSGLYKRSHYQRTGKGGALLSALQARYESALLTRAEYDAFGPHRLATGARAVAGLLEKGAVGPLSRLFGNAKSGLEAFGKQQDRIARVMDTFLPFVTEYHYVFSAAAVRRAHARLTDADRARIPWYPETLDWRSWFLDVHVPALERHVFPEMEARLERKPKAPRAHATLTSLLDDMALRHDLKVALQRTEAEGLSRLSYRDVRRAALRVAARLRHAGIARGDRVLLSGKNHPAWPVALFGILYAGATVVPFDPTLELSDVQNIARASRARLLIADASVEARVGAALELPALDLWSCASRGSDEEPVLGAEVAAAPDDLALLIYTSGTTGTPKGVMLSHKNITALVASLAPLFPLGTGDRVLSVLPLHHTFELSCGLLLPLSRGARIVYLDEVSGERLEHGLRASRATALIGVPALWEALERRIHGKVADKGPLFEWAFDAAVELSRSIGKQTGVDVGRALFGAVHQGLGGQLRYLVSGGAALGQDTHALFQGLGLHLAEGYGLTETAPVLTVSPGGPKTRAGNVGQPVIGVEIRIKAPDAQGVGEVLARGPNVMLGYADDEAATRAIIDEEGWLHTGDLGKLDGRGRLTLVGRAKDVVVSSSGENVYPEDVEARLGVVPHVAEYCIGGVPDGRGGQRLACAAVPSRDERGELERGAARDALQKALLALPVAQRPAIVELFDEPLERTSTKKIKRKAAMEAIVRAQKGEGRKAVRVLSGEAAGIVQAAVANLARRRPADVTPERSLRGDLGFDSLMALELLSVLEARLGRTLDAEALARAETVGQLSAALEPRSLTSTSSTGHIEEAETSELSLPAPLREAAMAWLGRGAESFYSRLMQTTVHGRAFIPHNRPTLVVANHTSHLDMGLVKHALGTYADDMVTLAAQDYFFEGAALKRAFFEQLSNLEPMPRTGALRSALRRAGEILGRGQTVLIFPEGTRSADGSLQPVKPAVGHLALHHQVDILPIWLSGTFQALPRGARVLQGRRLGARIGPPLEITDLQRLTQGLPSMDAARVVSRIAERAVAALGRGQLLDLNSLDIAELRRSTLPEEPGLAGVFAELEERFVTDAVQAPVSYYFSIGDERWTVRATAQDVEISRGKTVDVADCVLKTTPGAFERIVREAWVPGAADFVSGQIKTNNVAHLLTMQKLFQLNIPTSALRSGTGSAAE